MNFRTMKEIASYVIAGLSIVLTLYVVLFLEPGYYHADCTDTLMWAGASFDAGNFINTDFRYAALMPMGGNLLMWPWIAVFGLGMKAQIAGMVMFFALFVLTIVAICRQLKWNWDTTALALALVLVLTSSSGKMREIFWGHIIYYSLGACLAMAILATALRLRRTLIKNRNRFQRNQIVWIVLLIILTFLSGVNGFQIAAISSVPVFGAFAAQMFLNFRKSATFEKNKANYYTMAVMLGGIGLGILSIAVFTRGITAGYAAAYSTFSEVEEWTENLLSIPTNLFTLMGVYLEGDTILYSGAGMWILLRIIATVTLFGTPIVMLFHYQKIRIVEYKILLLTHHLMAVVILVGWIFGKLNAADWRLSPLVVTAALCCVVAIKELQGIRNLKRVGNLIAIPLGLMMLLIAIHCITIPNQSEENKAIEEVIGVLERADLDYGYATFWNANLITMMSDSKVKVRGVKFEEEGIIPETYQTNQNWYGKSGAHKKSFLLMDTSEYNEFLEMIDNSEKIIEQKQCGDYLILIYEGNIFNGVENAVY
ncbi:MAG: hypothetical protein K6G85_00295 [Eubacterium sp.]|nr:hypothetical protein [Eubacterium sp.]